mmetsp:Transcript_64606/g.185770  ORF Transcript_64606/g.185770 Transcript_64606/m.185770 type:complete len:232 (-) Transcript_64606:1420-2115(-)
MGVQEADVQVGQDVPHDGVLDDGREVCAVEQKIVLDIVVEAKTGLQLVRPPCPVLRLGWVARSAEQSDPLHELVQFGADIAGLVHLRKSPLHLVILDARHGGVDELRRDDIEDAKQGGHHAYTVWNDELPTIPFREERWKRATVLADALGGETGEHSVHRLAHSAEMFLPIQHVRRTTLSVVVSRQHVRGTAHRHQILAFARPEARPADNSLDVDKDEQQKHYRCQGRHPD